MNDTALINEPVGINPEMNLALVCTHCGNPVPRSQLAGKSLVMGEPMFCCRGCETVYGILTQSGLGDYYRLRDITGVKVGTPATPTGDSYSWLDDAAFVEAYKRDEAGRSMEFYLEGVHCAACVWLVEKLPELLPDVRSARLDLGRSVARIELVEGGSFAAVARRIDGMGYRPHAVRADEADALQEKENRRYLFRIGVAAVCNANIMLFSIAIYAGVTGSFATLFSWLSFALMLPVLFYSAVPFYESALTALRARRVSIDIPIVLGVVLGAALGFANLLKGGGAAYVYFDSLAMLLLLMLSSRYLTRRAQQKALGATNVLRHMLPASALRWSTEAVAFLEVPLDALREGDRVQVRVGDVVPVDGCIVTGETELNCAILTGESEPRPVARGDIVFCGTVNEGAAIEIEVTATGVSSRLGQIIELVEESRTRRARVDAWSDKASGWFTVIVLLIGAATFAWWAPRDLDAAFNNVMALFIITCPCALALSAPVAMLVSMGRAARRGMLIKGPDVLQRLGEADEILLDKTGTLTEGRFSVEGWEWIGNGFDREYIETVVHALEKNSHHPIARALIDYLGRRGVASEGFEFTDSGERIGLGVWGVAGDSRYEVRRLAAGDDVVGDVRTQVGCYVDDLLVARIALIDALREDASTAVGAFKALGLKPMILSGDGEHSVGHAAKVLQIEKAVWEATPETKLEIVKDLNARQRKVIMVGDGANDSAALAAAHVGVAVHGGMEISLRAADVYLGRPGMQPIVTLVYAARETMSVIYRNYGFSLFYNLIGGGAAVMGYMSPLFSAVLMPVSSLTILLSSYRGARSLR